MLFRNRPQKVFYYGTAVDFRKQTVGLAAVPADLADEPVQTFGSFTGDLHRLSAWLKDTGITTVAMESTGIYWIPVFQILQADGFEVLLINARMTKNVPGRKIDVNDAQWIRDGERAGEKSAGSVAGLATKTRS